MFNRKYIFKGSIFHCYVSLPECTFPKNNSLQFTVYQNRPVLPKQERFVWPNYHIFKSYVSVSWRVCHQLKIWNSCQHVLRKNINSACVYVPIFHTQNILGHHLGRTFHHFPSPFGGNKTSVWFGDISYDKNPSLWKRQNQNFRSLGEFQSCFAGQLVCFTWICSRCFKKGPNRIWWKMVIYHGQIRFEQKIIKKQQIPVWGKGFHWMWYHTFSIYFLVQLQWLIPICSSKGTLALFRYEMQQWTKKVLYGSCL